LEIISKSYLLLFPKIEGIEMMFSAARSRGLMIVAIVQGLIQLERNYGKEGAQIIRDNCQLTIFGGFAPGSETASTLSQNLGEQTVLSGSVSKGKDSNSRSLQMISRRLMTPDELKAMPKGSFITMKTGMHPMKTKFQLFLKWGITFGEAYTLEEHSTRKVEYASKEEVIAAIFEKYPPRGVEDRQEQVVSGKDEPSKKLRRQNSVHSPRSD